MSNVPMLSRKEELELLSAWRERRDYAARDRVISAYYRMCRSMASKYTKNESQIDALAQEGVFGLMQAVDLFNPDYGVRFSTYSRQWVRNFMAAKASEILGMISMPSRLFIDARMGRVDSNLRAVSGAAQTASLDAPVAEGADLTKADLLEDGSPSPEDVASFLSEYDYRRGLLDRAMAALSDRERDILRRRRLVDPVETLEMVAENYGLTRERIRQIEMKALEKVERSVRSFADGHEDDVG
jgi:RNA polymerase sigma factor (sigma-70 family)